MQLVREILSISLNNIPLHPRDNQFRSDLCYNTLSLSRSINPFLSLLINQKHNCKYVSTFWKDIWRVTTFVNLWWIEQTFSPSEVVQTVNLFFFPTRQIAFLFFKQDLELKNIYRLKEKKYKKKSWVAQLHSNSLFSLTSFFSLSCQERYSVPLFIQLNG